MSSTLHLAFDRAEVSCDDGVWLCGLSSTDGDHLLIQVPEAPECSDDLWVEWGDSALGNTSVHTAMWAPPVLILMSKLAFDCPFDRIHTLCLDVPTDRGGMALSKLMELIVRAAAMPSRAQVMPGPGTVLVGSVRKSWSDSKMVVGSRIELGGGQTVSCYANLPLRRDKKEGDFAHIRLIEKGTARWTAEWVD